MAGREVLRELTSRPESFDWQNASTERYLSSALRRLSRGLVQTGRSAWASAPSTPLVTTRASGRRHLQVTRSNRRWATSDHFSTKRARCRAAWVRIRASRTRDEKLKQTQTWHSGPTFFAISFRLAASAMSHWNHNWNHRSGRHTAANRAALLSYATQTLLRAICLYQCSGSLAHSMPAPYPRAAPAAPVKCVRSRASMST